MIAQFSRRWSMRSLRAAAAVGLISWSAVWGQAQSTAPAADAASAVGRRTYTKNTTFSLPIQIDDAQRSTLSEIRLYVKSGRQKWVQHETAAPYAPFFTCKAPSDGEYCFMLVTVDRQGRQTPSDIDAQPPTLRVVVDTAPPVLEMSATMDNGLPILQVNMVDAHPDLKSIQALTLTESGEQRALSPVPGRTGAFQLNASDMALPIRITGNDMSGNLVTRQVAARDLVAGMKPPAWSTAQAPAPATQPTTQPAAQPAPVALPLLASQPIVPPVALPTLPGMGIVSASYSPPSLEPAQATVGRVDPGLVPDGYQPGAKPNVAAAPTEELKKLAAERDELRAQLTLRERERDNLNAQLAERTKEIIDLRVQTVVRTQESEQLARDVQALLRRVEASVQPSAK